MVGWQAFVMGSVSAANIKKAKVGKTG